MSLILTKSVLSNLNLIFLPYDNKPCNILFAGGSVIHSLNEFLRTTTLNKGKWYFYLSDERCDENNKNSNEIRFYKDSDKYCNSVCNNSCNNSCTKTCTCNNSCTKTCTCTKTKTCTCTICTCTSNTCTCNTCTNTSTICIKTNTCTCIKTKNNNNINTINIYNLSSYKKLIKDKIMDLAILGIGENGHICSLWPNSPYLDSKDTLIQVEVQDKIKERITVTLKYLNENTKQIYFLLPYKNGKPKKIKDIDISIKKRLNKEYTVIYEE